MMTKDIFKPALIKVAWLLWLICLATLALPVKIFASSWWNPLYQERFLLKILNNNDQALPEGYTVTIVLDHALLVNQARSRPDGSDVRIIYHSGQTGRELDRIGSDPTGWNQPETRIFFQTQKAIEEQDDAYFIYFNNPGATTAPADPDQVFSLAEDFDSYQIGSLPPDWQKFGSDAELKVEISGEQAVSGSKSLKLSGNGWALSAYRPSPIGLDYTASVKFLTLDQVNEGGLFFRSDLSNRFHPSWLFQMGDWWFAGGPAGNLKASSNLARPEAGEWHQVEVKVVGSRIVSLRVDGQEGLADLTSGWNGNYLGFPFRASKLVYYDDLLVKKAVLEEPKVETVAVEEKPLPWLQLTLTGTDLLVFEKVVPFKPVSQDFGLQIATNLNWVNLKAGLTGELAKTSSGKVLAPWNGSTGLGIKLAGTDQFKPLSSLAVDLYQTNQTDLPLSLPLELILATDFLDPAGTYQTDLVLTAVASDEVEP